MFLTQLNDWSSSIGRSFIYIFILLAVLFIAYYLTRFFNTRVRGFQGGNIKIVEGMGVGQNGNLLIVKAGKKYLLLGVTKEKISYLSDIDAEDIEIKDPPQTGRVFDMYLKNFLKGKNNER